MDLDIIKEVLDYNERDSLVLQEGFFNFRDLIFKNFNVDIVNSLTIASLSYKIYLTSFYKDNTLHTLDKPVDDYIRKSYFGGKTEVYKPYSEHCYSYDCNSLYSHVMKNFSYPTGTPKYVRREGITEKIKTKKGFFQVRVSAPENLKHPFLVYHDDLKSYHSGLHSDSGLISPLGEWTGTYFSEEINYARELGYTFEYIDGYFYDNEEYIFKDFVDSLYDMRLKYKKNTGLNKTCKLLLNSLYGKFGMKMDNAKTEIVALGSNRYKEIFSKHTILSHRVINNLEIITYFADHSYLSGHLDYDKEVKEKLMSSYNSKSNVAIASAVTSYARIYMDVCMRKIGFKNIYYTDTDSIFSSVPIDNSMVSDSGLGKFKLEGILGEAVFIAPKMYSYKNNSTNKEKVVFKGFPHKSFNHDDFKKHYLENTVLSSEKENFFIRNFRFLEIRSSTSTRTHNDKFKKRTKIFNEKKQWIDTAPLIVVR